MVTQELVELIRFSNSHEEPETTIITKERICGRIESGAIVSISREKCIDLFPIVNGILVLLPPERIHATEERELIRSLLAWLGQKHSGYASICREYLDRMSQSRMDEKDHEIAFYDRKYREFYHRDMCSNRAQYGDHWYTAVRDVLNPMQKWVTSGARILEIAGGNFVALPFAFSLDRLDCLFVGTEISYWALLCGRKVVPNGQFVQVDSDFLNFKPSVFDAIFIKGALHHQSRKEKALPDLVSFLKPGGLLGFTEVVRDRGERSRFVKWAKARLEPEKHTSPMNESIDRRRVLAYLEENTDIISLKERMSVLRYLLVRLLSKQKVKSLILSKLIVWADDIMNELPLLRSYWLTSTHIMSVVVRKRA